MSQENVETVRQGLDALNRRDRATWMALVDPALENISPRDWPESGRIEGAEPIFDFFVEVQDSWEEISTYEYDELIDAGDDKVLTHMSARLKGKASGATVAWSYWQVVTFKGDKVARVEWFGDRTEALEAAGHAAHE
jgi:ketosteroid isomerase-like protein